MRCPTIDELPPPLLGKKDWPWTDKFTQLAPIIFGRLPRVKISVVIPSYNQAKFIEEAIRSVLLQGYPYYELVIIDAESTDGTANILKKYDQWIAYRVCEKDKGQSDAINKGFQKCSGQIISFIGGDDMYLPGVFWDIASHWPKIKNYGAIVGSFVFMDENSDIEEPARPPILPHEGPIDLSIGPPGIYRLHQVSTFYTRKALDSVGRRVREELQYTMDRELLYRVCAKFKTCLADQTYGAFRRHKDSKSLSKILPFYREFSKLPLLFLNSETKKNKMRKHMSRHFLAKGYIKCARQSERNLFSAMALLKALSIQPTLGLQQSYLSKWVDVFKVRAILQRLRSVNL
jgi:glycosyltransferase involved in cell wall biosynthesis